MEESSDKVVPIVFLIICLAAAAGIVHNIYFNKKTSPAIEARRTLMKCSECGEVVEMDVKEFQRKWEKLMRQTDPEQPPIFDCPKCGNKTLKPARICPKCGEIFIEDMFSKGFADKCPKCGYSAAEESRKR